MRARILERNSSVRQICDTRTPPRPTLPTHTHTHTNPSSPLSGSRRKRRLYFRTSRYARTTRACRTTNRQEFGRVSTFPNFRRARTVVCKWTTCVCGTRRKMTKFGRNISVSNATRMFEKMSPRPDNYSCIRGDIERNKRLASKTFGGFFARIPFSVTYLKFAHGSPNATAAVSGIRGEALVKSTALRLSGTLSSSSSSSLIQ